MPDLLPTAKTSKENLQGLNRALQGTYNSATAFGMLLSPLIRYPWEYYCDYTLWHQKLRHREKNAKMA